MANSRAGERDPIAAATLSLLSFPLLMSGDLERSGAAACSDMALRSAVESYPDAVMRHRCGLMLYSWGHISTIRSCSRPSAGKHIWQRCLGLLDVANSYDYDLDHAFLNAKTNGELFHALANLWSTCRAFRKIEAALTQFDRG